MPVIAHAHPARVVLLLTALLAALALGITRGTSNAAQEGNVLDLVVWTFPFGERIGAGSGNCIEIGGGTLDLSVRVIGPGTAGPVEFFFHPFGGSDAGARVETVVGQDEMRYSLPLSGGRYCYSVANRAFVDPNSPPQLLTDLGQAVALRMTLS